MTGNGETNQFGKYELIAHLATGGMAEIYLARQTGIGGFEKLLVIKRILPHLAREDLFVQMFFDEARIAARLNHQNIVQIYDLGRVDDQYFIAMEYLEGESLSAVIRKVRKSRSPLSPLLAAGIALQVCEGLHYAHTMVGPDGVSLQVVHRDVNPQNVFVLYSGGVKLVDFGIAKATNRFSHTTTGMLKGKYGYMSPEQVKELPLDARADVFSAGVVLWEMLTGRRLFRQSSELEMLKAITEEDTPPPSSVVPSVPKELDEITLRALRRSRELRYQTAGEMRMELAFMIKRSKEPSDTVAIGEHMQSMFFEQMASKRQLIKTAQEQGTSLSKTLFGDLHLSSRSDTEPSISRDTPSFAKAKSTSGQSVPVNSVGRRKRLFLWSGGAFLLCLCVILVVYWALGIQAGQTPEGDAGLLPVSSRVSGADAGPVVEDAPGSTMVVVPVSDEQQPDKVVRKKRKKKKASGLSRKKVISEKTKPDPVTTKDQAPGMLRLATTPWTTIFLKKRKLGITPLVDVELPAGRHTLRAVNPEKGIEKVIVVDIKPGETTTKTVRF